MLENLIRRVTAMTVFLAVIVGIWLAAWCKSVQAEADRRYWPALSEPVRYPIQFDNSPSTQPAP
jgi:hypothetical protein